MMVMITVTLTGNLKQNQNYYKFVYIYFLPSHVVSFCFAAPKVMIVDEFGDPLQEKYYEQDSTLQLSCVVRNVAMSSSVVYWKHSEDVLNYDVTRGGVR